jgi:hypothetical protein
MNTVLLDGNLDPLEPGGSARRAGMVQARHERREPPLEVAETLAKAIVDMHHQWGLKLCTIA